MVTLLNKRVMVKVNEVEEKVGSFFIVSADQSESENIGEVVGCADDISEVVIGDKILFDRGAGNSVEISGGKFLILKIENVIAVLG